MRIEWHILSALPFVASGNWAAAAGCLAPDLSLAATEWAIRTGKGDPRDVLTPAASPATWVAYQAAHSPVFVVASAAVSPWFAVGVLVHLLLDWRAHWWPWRPNWRWPFRAVRADRHAVVPLSGGADSAACLCAAVSAGHATVTACFIDYGQPYAQSERAAARAIATHLGVRLDECNIDPPLRMDASGAFENRNAALLDFVVDRYPLATSVYFGTRNVLPLFDRFGDSNAAWAWRHARRLGVAVHVPVAGWPKRAVYGRLLSYGIPRLAVFSTEGWKP